jgi:hypothetical protein
MDAALTKNVYLSNGQRLTGRIEVYNVFNRRQWSFPQTDFASTTFGRITSQFNAPRSVQLQVRWIF